MKKLITLLFFFFIGSHLCNAQFISTDDKLHFGAGAVLSSATYTLVYLTTKNSKKAFWYSLGASFVAGLAKEAIDAGQDERFDTGELVATTLGGLTASMTFNLFTGKKKKKKQKEAMALVM